MLQRKKLMPRLMSGVTFHLNRARQHLFKLIQCKPLNVITLGQRQSDNIKSMITLTEDNIYQPFELYFKF